MLPGGGGGEALTWCCLFTGLVGEEGSAAGATQLGMAVNMVLSNSAAPSSAEAKIFNPVLLDR